MSDRERADVELPLLTFEVAREIGEFQEFPMTITDADVALYLAATGVAGSHTPGVVPPGYAAIIGRLGYLREHRMPGGGVLLGQEIQWLAPAAVGKVLMIKSVVERVVEDDRGRRRIVFETTASQFGRLVTRIRITAGWPS